tara:strand:- start:515 stop:910 length:396 start_codon:yes stop_codon:yes gene_type:complete
MSDKTTTVKPAKKARVKISNESKLQLPQDVEGFSSNFRREAARSVGRIMSDERKLKVFIELLEHFKNYAEDRFEQNAVERKAILASKAEALKEAQAVALRNAEHVIKGKRANAMKLMAEIEAHDKKVAASK